MDACPHCGRLQPRLVFGMTADPGREEGKGAHQLTIESLPATERARRGRL